MEYLIRTLSKYKAFTSLYSANFMLALHLFLVVYINSNYLTQYLPEQYVGLVYVIGSIVGVTALAFITNILGRFGNWKTLLVLAVLELLIFIGLAFPGTGVIALLLFVAYLALYPLILFTLDIFLETYTKKEENTGSVRGTFLTTTNVALIISPLIAGFILGDGFYDRVFITSAFFLIPFIFIIAKHFRNFEDPPYTHFTPRGLLGCIRANKDLYAIFKAHFVMRLFFAWMVIYTPLYLHEHIGFSWPTIGVMFTIMLLPYLFIELPAGKIADLWLGEKELLIAGFVITGISVASMSLISSTSVIVWTALLVLTRVGAALIEVMTETYFFRHVDGDDANTISGFRMVRPLSYIVAPLIATLALLLINIQYIFLLFGIVMLLGIIYSLPLKDTR